MDNKSPPKPANVKDDEDFSASMARLTELATKGLAPEKPKETLAGLSEGENKDYLRPKRNLNAKKGFKDRWLGKSIKIKINPYTAGGLLIVILASGFLGVPHIVKYLEERNAAFEREKMEAALVSSQTEVKLKNYTVFDAISDSGNKNPELKTKSIAELAKSVEEANKIAEEKAKAQQLLQSEDITLTSYDQNKFPDFQNEQLQYRAENSLYSDVPNGWDLTDEQLLEHHDFNWQQNCSGISELVADDNLFYSDVLKSLGVVAKDPNPVCK